jgi:hypothetical protein
MSRAQGHLGRRRRSPELMASRMRALFPNHTRFEQYLLILSNSTFLNRFLASRTLPNRKSTFSRIQDDRAPKVLF